MEDAADAVVFPQSRARLLRVLPLAIAMTGGSGLLFVVGLRGAGPIALLGGLLGLTFFGPALLILAWGLVSPNYLEVHPQGLRFRLHGLEATIPWEEIREVSGGVGWPSLTFHDCERVARDIRFRGFRPLGWLLEVPTRIVSLIIRRPLANMYPTTRRQLADAFRANERMFTFHYGLPTSLVEGSGREIIEAMKRARAG